MGASNAVLDASRTGLRLRSIAVIRLSSVGDVIMAMPAVERLREAHPTAHIAWVVEGRARNILEGFPAIDEIIEFPRTLIRELWKKPFGLLRCTAPILAFRRELRRRRFDLSIDFQGNLKSAACTVMAGARRRLGYDGTQCREPNHWFTNEVLRLNGQEMHRMDRDLLLAGLAGARFGFTHPRIHFSAEDRRVGCTVIRNPGVGPPVVVLHPGTSDFMPHKRWPLERYAAFGDVLSRRAGARILLSWGPGEEPMVNEIRKRMQQPSEILPPTPTIKSLGHVLQRADLVVGGDTGPIHLAVALGTPTLILLGPGDPRHYYPHGHPERVFYHRVPCSPCRNRSCALLACMSEISVDEVAERALTVLAERSAHSPPEDRSAGAAS